MGYDLLAWETWHLFAFSTFLYWMTLIFISKLTSSILTFHNLGHSEVRVDRWVYFFSWSRKVFHLSALSSRVLKIRRVNLKLKAHIQLSFAVKRMWVDLASFNSASCTFNFHWKYAILYLICHLCVFLIDCLNWPLWKWFWNEQPTMNEDMCYKPYKWWIGNNSLGHSFFWPGQFARGSSAAIK